MEHAAVEVRALGDTGLHVGCVGLGTYRVFNVKGDAGEARCDAVVDAALAAGSRLFDTSPMYGSAERVLAKTLEDRRDQAVVAAKVWAKDRATGGQQIEQTLDLFETVDVYQVHNLLALGEHMPQLRDLKNSGRVRALGVESLLGVGH